jgi:hypothetical protein
LQILDAQNEALLEKIRDFWLGFLLHEPPMIHSAWSMTGSLNAAKPDVRSLRELPKVFQQYLGKPRQLKPSTLLGTTRLAAHFQTIRSSRVLAGRLERGLAAFVSGMKMAHIDEAVLSFERALEGILQPNDKDQFTKRAKCIIRPVGKHRLNVAKLLNDIYDARSGFTHAEALDTVFPGLSRRQAERRGWQLRSAVFHLASRCYREILAREDLVRLFSAEGLGDYWGEIVSGDADPPFLVDLAPEDCWGASH